MCCNSDWAPAVKPEKLPEIKAYPFGCTAWTGTSDAEKTIVSRDPALKIVERVTSNMRLEIDPAMELPGQPRENTEYYQRSADLERHGNGLVHRWRSGASGHHRSRSGRRDRDAACLGRMRRCAIRQHWPWPGDVPTYTIRCPNQPPTQMILFMALGWWTTDMQQRHGRRQRHDDPRNPHDEPGRCHPGHHRPAHVPVPPVAVGRFSARPSSAGGRGIAHHGPRSAGDVARSISCRSSAVSWNRRRAETPRAGGASSCQESAQSKVFCPSNHASAICAGVALLPSVEHLQP